MWRRRSHRDEDLREEIQSHLAMAERDRIDRGMSSDTAHADARREFGNEAHVREATRAVWRWTWLDTVTQDIRYAVRGCRRSPVFTLVAVVALGTAIGLGTSVFTAFNTFFLAEWPVREPSRLAHFWAIPGIGASDCERLAAETQTFREITTTTRLSTYARVQGRDVRFNAVSANFFDVLGVPMAMGRAFGDGEAGLDTPAPVVVLSHRIWRSAFGADADIIGKQIAINRQSLLVVGVSAREFTGTTIDDVPEFWVPLSAASLLDVSPNALGNLRMIGRLAEGDTRESAQAEMNVLVGRMNIEENGPSRRVMLFAATYVPLAKAGDFPGVGLMLLSVLLVLLLACANVGNLLLARAAARAGETATRLSLGASRGRLIRQFLTESALLALVACAFGIALSFVLPQFVMDSLVATSSRPLDLAVRFTPDLTVVAFACGLAVVTVVAFGLAPALLASRQAAATVMKAQSVTLSARLGPRRLLLAAQVAISTVLLVSAGLMIKSVERASNVDLGFDLEHVSEASIDLPRFFPDAQRLLLTQTFFDDAQRLDPGAIAIWSQRFGYASGDQVTLPEAPELSSISTVKYFVTPSFFSVMGIPLVAGRTFDRSTPDGIVVSETLAEHLWPGQSPIGRVVRLGAEPRRIAGVAADADLGGASFWGEFTQARGRLAVYEPLTTTSQAARLLIRRDRPDHTEALASLAGRIEREATLELKPLTDTRDERLGSGRISANLAGLIGIAALAIATVGIAGVFGYVARQRRREIGIRVALGARSFQILRGVFGSSVRALAIGMAAGFFGAALAAPLLQGYVHRSIGSFDLGTYLVVGVILATAAVAATIAPARHASRVNPITVLKSE